MKKINNITRRFSVLMGFTVLFVALSFVLRMVLFLWEVEEINSSILAIIKTLAIGFFYDLGTVSFFLILYTIYLILIPEKLIGSMLDKVFTYIGLLTNLLVIYFSFFAELTFWEEFHNRFNFIAVDYLIYTYEVIDNINESYPLPLLMGGILVLVGITIFTFSKMNLFRSAFNNTTSIVHRGMVGFAVLAIALIFAVFVSNQDAEWSTNRYNNEISKAGIYSFFAAFRNNEMDYNTFYALEPLESANEIVRKKLSNSKVEFLGNEGVFRKVANASNNEIRPNVILICVESLSASFMESFGNKDGLTPYLDSLAENSIFFTNLFATGTRTVRGMEAISLSIPPTPGRSIVKRPKNAGLFTINEVFHDKGYDGYFYYGGDGYFDNMNAFFSGNGFKIIDRGRGYIPEYEIKTSRELIADEEIHFENAWGISDEDLFEQVIKHADSRNAGDRPFFDFVMTTSNHRPYTFPEGKIDLIQGSRSAAVKYTDFAIHDLIRKASQKLWFKNTVFIVMADHCASSAGKWELDIKNYRIPALVYNLPGYEAMEIDKLCSQIDIFPTLFSMMGWEYNSNFFGQNVLDISSEEERAFVGNYRKLGLLKKDKLMVLDDQMNSNFYHWDANTFELEPLDMDYDYLNETIAYYQLASYLYKHDGLKVNHNER
ncbi:sulfatase-like hydrolase/transferase [Echinicola sp. CAU 1574]|uniref:Sulfatase-like hydrolase/transferase n=1 Tax=Echinicola arenosa TaxID=2774144 RepID=A0ABR9AK27_9BACT|nr:alkaline phosphatase family protein [Echinicola arenosa]MBD8489127.1 sulfatase-like hydrolase/transferase [Echinicola arenosa]